MHLLLFMHPLLFMRTPSRHAPARTTTGLTAIGLAPVGAIPGLPDIGTGCRIEAATTSAHMDGRALLAGFTVAAIAAADMDMETATEMDSEAASWRSLTVAAPIGRVTGRPSLPPEWCALSGFLHRDT